MLKTLSPLLSADLLYHLCAMGHGDEIAIVDGNFPAASCARNLVVTPGLDATQILDAVMSVFPLESAHTAAFHMAQVDNPDIKPAICEDFSTILNAHEGTVVALQGLERYAFYERVKCAYLVVSTTEARLYGNIILTKGVIAPQ
ncbi:MAG: RbsD/FucU family protein [Pseudomonadales bacterium]